MRLAAGQERAQFNDDRVALVCTRSGCGQHRCGGRAYEAHRDVGYLFGSDCVWTATADASWRLDVLLIDSRTLLQIAEQAGVGLVCGPSGSTRIVEHAGVRLVQRFIATLTAPHRFSVALAALVDMIAALSGTTATADPIERPAIRRIRQQLTGADGCRIPLLSAARHVSLSRFHLHRLFRNEIGVPPGRYSALVRVARAERFLRAGLAIADAAQAAGFYDQSHLNRSCRRLRGVTPRQYQAACMISSTPGITLESALSYRFHDGVPLLHRWTALRRAIPSKTNAHPRS